MSQKVLIDWSIGFPLVGVTLKELAKLSGGELKGADREVRYLTRLGDPRSEGAITYVTSPGYWEEFLRGSKDCAIVSRAALPSSPVDTGKSYIVTPGNAEADFFALQETLFHQSRYSKLSPRMGVGCMIHPTVAISGGVVIEDNVRIDAHCTIYPNSVLEEGVWLKAGTVIGGDGLEVKSIAGRRKKVVHTGGVFVGRGVELGSLISVDSDLFGGFTSIGEGTMIDDSVHIAHSASVGKDCSITACVDIGGMARVGNGVWLAPRTAILNQIVVGDHVLSGIGSVIMRDVPNHAFVMGYPAKSLGWVCTCRAKVGLTPETPKATCEKCGRCYQLIDGKCQPFT
ncbi:MAG: hypothetical protein HYR96_11425 [Deltaproteobacteria bacterium]|nr:hypothetical protein [Deltaproteobacteria bacterium]MBI3293260.1 hypothetical protein [Deltaproteobacteria bacterium]